MVSFGATAAGFVLNGKRLLSTHPAMYQRGQRSSSNIFL